MHSICANLQVCVGDHVHQLVEIHVYLQSDLLLIFASVSVPNGWDCMGVHNENHALEHPCIR